MVRSIKELAKDYNMSTRTLRYYEEVGILQPARLGSGMRHYSRREEAKIKLIVRGKKYGFSLEEIKEMILLFDLDRTGIKQMHRTIEYGEQKIAEIDDKIRELYEIREEMNSIATLFRQKIAQLTEDEK